MSLQLRPPPVNPAPVSVAQAQGTPNPEGHPSRGVPVTTQPLTGWIAAGTLAAGAVTLERSRSVSRIARERTRRVSREKRRAQSRRESYGHAQDRSWHICLRQPQSSWGRIPLLDPVACRRSCDDVDASTRNAGARIRALRNDVLSRTTSHEQEIIRRGPRHAGRPRFFHLLP